MWLVTVLELAYLASVLTFWVVGFLAYFWNFTGLARWAGALYLPILALPFVGRGEVAGFAVRSFAWWGWSAFPVLLAALALLLYREVAASDGVGGPSTDMAARDASPAESRDGVSRGSHRCPAASSARSG